MEIAIVGVAVSLLVEWLKRQFGTDEWKTLSVLAVVCLLAAAGYTYLRAVGYLDTVVGVLVTASAFYALVITRFK
jgi:NhaP-type Na+/H+ or K+/H+ antiporter